MDWLKRSANGESHFVSEYLPFCTNEKIFSPNVKVTDSEKCDVSFVGTLWDPYPFLQMISLGLKSDEQKDDFHKVFQAYLSNYDSVFPAQLRKSLNLEHLTDVEVKNLTDDFISTRKRLDILEGISDLDVRIHGTKSWAGYSLLVSQRLFERFSMSKLESSTSLAALYQRSRCAISIAHYQAQSGFPIRIFDVLATGTPLISDRHSELSELFEENKMYLSFESREEARAQVDRVLKDRAYAEKMGVGALAEIRGKHTFSHRVASIVGKGLTASGLTKVNFVSSLLDEGFLMKDPGFQGARFERWEAETGRQHQAISVSRKVIGVGDRFFGALKLWGLAIYLPMKYLSVKQNRPEKSIKADLKYLWGTVRSVMKNRTVLLKEHIHRYRQMISSVIEEESIP